MSSIAAGDAQALKALYDRHAGLVFTVCLRIVRERSEAEDLLTEIFFELWQKSDRYNAMRGSPVSYLLTLSRSRAIDRKRRKRLTNDGTLDTVAAASAEPTPADATEANERGALVNRCFDRLEGPQRQAIECAFYDGLSHSEISTKLSRPLGTIKTQIRQGMMRLRDCLGKFFDSADMASRSGPKSDGTR
ncbi:N/A [soil metagenome]